MSLLNKYYFDKSYIVDKHDPNHEKMKKCTHPNFYLHSLSGKIGSRSTCICHLGRKQRPREQPNCQIMYVK